MRVLYVVNNAGFFCSHRLPLALRARQLGHQVALVTGQPGSATIEAGAETQLREHDLPHHRVAFHSGGLSPWSEGRGFFQLVGFIRQWRPDLVHCVSPKAVLYGGLAARLGGVRSLVLAVSGMGSLFASGGGLTSWLKRAYLHVARLAYGHPNSAVIVQNEDDRHLLMRHGLARSEQITLIPGSGVLLESYAGVDEARRSDLVVLPARLLRDKGVCEFVTAARLLKAQGCSWRFALVGTADYDNPSSIGEAEVRRWVDEGAVEWWGHCEDMVEVFAQARIVCLPSYREGMPKALLEAAAAGCAVVTTDTVGCRDAILPGVSGDLVPVRDAHALARALGALIQDPTRQQAYGHEGRKLARARFSLEAVVATTMALYNRMVPNPTAGH